MHRAAASVSRSQPFTFSCCRLLAAAPLQSALMPTSVTRSQPFKTKLCTKQTFVRPALLLAQKYYRKVSRSFPDLHVLQWWFRPHDG